jgi:hypothetical protein
MTAHTPLSTGWHSGGRAGKADERGKPQEGPLSPLLLNILLDGLDKGLERRTHILPI